MTGSGPALDVVILTWNDGPLLRQALESVLTSCDVAVSVWVVDNGSNSPAEVDLDARVHLIRNEDNRGVAAGRNQGIRAGDAPLICLLDSDAELAPNSLAALIAPLEADHTIGCAVPVFRDQQPEASAGAAPTLAVKLGRVLDRRDDYRPVPRSADAGWWNVDFGIGACQVFRRTAWEAVGGIDETFFYGPEDVDFCLRLQREGWRTVQVGGADVFHPPRRRYRKPFSRRGVAHAWAVTRFLWRHRNHHGRGTVRPA